VADPVVCSDDAKSEASQIETGPLRLPLAPHALIDIDLAYGNYPRLERGGLQALTVARMVPKTVAPVAWRAVSTTVRIAASP
jgi:hypothetical protein